MSVNQCIKCGRELDKLERGLGINHCLVIMQCNIHKIIMMEYNIYKMTKVFLIDLPIIKGIMG